MACRVQAWNLMPYPSSNNILSAEPIKNKQGSENTIRAVRRFEVCAAPSLVPLSASQRPHRMAVVGGPAHGPQVDVVHWQLAANPWEPVIKAFLEFNSVQSFHDCRWHSHQASPEALRALRAFINLCQLLKVGTCLTDLQQWIQDWRTSKSMYRWPFFKWRLWLVISSLVMSQLMWGLGLKQILANF